MASRACQLYLFTLGLVKGELLHGAYPNMWLDAQQANTTDTGSPATTSSTSRSSPSPMAASSCSGRRTPMASRWRATGTDVIGQRYDVEGQKVGAEFRAFAAGGNEGHFAAAARPDGSLVIAYEDDRFDINGFKDGTVIRAVIVTPEGTLSCRRPSSTTLPCARTWRTLDQRHLDGSFIVSYQNSIAADAITSAEFAAFDATGALCRATAFPLPTGALAVGGQHTDSALLANGNTWSPSPLCCRRPTCPPRILGSTSWSCRPLEHGSPRTSCKARRTPPPPSPTRP